MVQKLFKNFSLNKKLILFSIVLILLSSFPLFTKLFISGSDLRWWYNTIIGMRENILKWHQIPYRINYYGQFPSQQPIFYHSIFLYISVFFSFIFGIENGLFLNFTYLFMNIISFINMYFLSKKIYKNKFIAIGSALFYLFCLYRLIDIYRRAAIGESFALCFLPLFILSVYYLFFDDYRKWYLFVLSSTFIFWSHLITTIFCIFIFAVFFIVFLSTNFDLKKLYIIFKSIITTFLLNFWLFIPIIYEFLFVRFINPTNYQFYEFKSTYPINISSFLNFFPNSNSLTDIGFSFFFGILFLIIIIFVNIYKFVKIKNLKNNSNLGFINIFSFVSLIISLFFLFLSFDISDSLLFNGSIKNSIFSFIQFKYRFNIITMPFLSISFSYYFYNLIKTIFKNNNYHKYIYLVLMFLISSFSSIIFLFNVYKNSVKFNEIEPFSNIDYYLVDSLYYENNTSFPTIKKFDNFYLKSNNNINISKIKKNKINNDIRFEYNIKNKTNDDYIVLDIFNYPVYSAYDENNKIINIESGEYGRIKLNFTKNNGIINIIQKEPLSWLLADFISIFTLLFLVFSLFKSNLYSFILKNR